jgi:hypothetical protein
MNNTPTVHLLSLLFELATNMVVPHVTKRSERHMWPVDSQDAFDDLAKQVQRLETWKILPDRWPFRSDAGKVVSTISEIVSVLEANSKEPSQKYRKTICYTLEYFSDLVFQRFFAWTTWTQCAEKMQDTSKDHFYYRNGCANVRAIMAMPLTTDLFRELRGVIGQGNFAYKPSVIKSWIYPHLDDYLAAFYYPWIPDIPTDKQKDDESCSQTTLRRGIFRSKNVCREVWQLLRCGRSLRETIEDRSVPLQDVKREFFEPSFQNEALQNEIISPFALKAVASDEIGLKYVWDGQWEEPGPDGLSMDDITAEIEQLYDAGPSLLNNFFDEISNVMRRGSKELSKALTGELRARNWSKNANLSALDDILVERELLGSFLRWRFLEERLRLTLDRLLLARRQIDPNPARTFYQSWFEDLGIRAIEIPDIQFALCMQEFQNDPACLHRPCPAKDPREQQCNIWLDKALVNYKNKEQRYSIWERGEYPRHALFESYLRGEVENDFVSFSMALLLSRIVPPPEARMQEHSHNNSKQLLRWLGENYSQDDRPFAQLHSLLEETRDTPTYEAWSWVYDKLERLFHKKPEEITTNDVRKGVGNTWPMNKNEDKEREYHSRHFFHNGSFYGINPKIFKALKTFGVGQNFLTIRLIAPERGGSRHASTEYQDFADFIGTYIVWSGQRGEDYRFNPASRSDGLPNPSFDTWNHDKSEPRHWMTELHFQKILIRKLGVTLVNQVRTVHREKDAADSEWKDISAGVMHTISNQLSSPINRVGAGLSALNDKDAVDQLRPILHDIAKELETTLQLAQNVMDVGKPQNMRRDQQDSTPPQKLGKTIDEGLQNACAALLTNPRARAARLALRGLKLGDLQAERVRVEAEIKDLLKDLNKTSLETLKTFHPEFGLEIIIPPELKDKPITEWKLVQSCFTEIFLNALKKSCLVVLSKRKRVPSIPRVQIEAASSENSEIITIYVRCVLQRDSWQPGKEIKTWPRPSRATQGEGFGMWFTQWLLRKGKGDIWLKHLLPSESDDFDSEMTMQFSTTAWSL